MLDTRRFRPHQVLGDAQQYYAALEQKQHREQQTNTADVASCVDESRKQELRDMDPASVPQEIWAAAQLLGDSKGVHLLHIYHELAEQR